MRLSDHRLRKNQYNQVFREGRKLKAPGISLRVLTAPDKQSRVGFVIKKKTGTAVKRIFLRRLFRECFRESLPGFTRPCWIIFDVFPRPLEMTKGEIRERVFSILRAL